MGNLRALRGVFDGNTLRLFLCGMSALYWELVLIRWLSSCIRIVAYFSNFVLIAAFFGLGAGALLARYPWRMQRLIFPAVSLAVLLGVLLSGSSHLNPTSADEYFWLGAPAGIDMSGEGTGLLSGGIAVPLILALVYACTAFVFILFGQWIGRLFKTHRPLWAYSVEIAGSISGIALFAVLSLLQSSAIVWMVVGFILLIFVLEKNSVDWGVAVACTALVLTLVAPIASSSLWSPYYRIKVAPLTSVSDVKKEKVFQFQEAVGYTLTVNNDYHQMLLDLAPGKNEHPFLSAWRAMYDWPYKNAADLPAGPILVVGAGTGNDVSAALRGTGRQVVAVEIDPVILDIGRERHFEQPYADPRVEVVTDDARTFFHSTDRKYAMVVFGFLDSHTLLSSFSSVRLDNFVYTEESMRQVKRLLLPGGKVHLAFASNRVWLHDRLISLLNGVFDYPTSIAVDPSGYSNGITYSNGKAPGESVAKDRNPSLVPTDDWPFLYLRTPTIPSHYRVFILLVLVLGFSSLLFLPRGERSVRLPYFFLGAGFFLIETSNVVSLSLMFGSTWYVNVLVFIGILLLVLAGNLVSHMAGKPRLTPLMLLLVGSVGVAYVTPTSFLLGIDMSWLRAAAAVVIFLGPVFFASLIFATLIKEEADLYQAYGSNVLGAVVGGVCEYLSLVFGFKFLLVITLGFYLMVYLLLLWERPPALAKGKG